MEGRGGGGLIAFPAGEARCCFCCFLWGDLGLGESKAERILPHKTIFSKPLSCSARAKVKPRLNKNMCGGPPGNFWVMTQGIDQLSDLWNFACIVPRYRRRRTRPGRLLPQHKETTTKCNPTRKTENNCPPC